MSINRAKQELVDEKIEFESDKILELIKKFWRFSRFYGEYLGSMHTGSNKQLKLKNRRQKE